MRSIILAMLAVLTCLCSRPSTHAQLLNCPFVEDKQPIIHAVLEAELRRQDQMFEEVTQLSSENIDLIPSLEISGRKIVVLDANGIREKVKDGNGLTYMLFKSFEAKDGMVSVRLARVIEQDRCFGGYFKESTDYIYVARKVDDRWQAELKGRSIPAFGDKASVKFF
ncbi:MAG TPA: hypothetical protein VNA16_01460 [Abditibacteriaceae bacterium]|nr:hypothetical protein [Abditibacteriaceae bacterium]